jgi:DNA-directed RNA polymerase subunit RPC12/RpoP
MDCDEGTSEAATPRIEVQCLNCGRSGSFDGDDARVRGTPLVTLTRRLRCSACGSRAVRATSVRTPRDIARLLRSRMKPAGD